MTSATTFATLLAPVLDDSMEVSSPAGNQYDDEVLIDYDDFGTTTMTEDERMNEDGEPARPGTATDDMMEDDVPADPVNEEIMHDDPVTAVPDTYVEDEELIDYSDDEYHDDTQATLDNTIIQQTETAESSFAALAPTAKVIEPDHVDAANVQPLEDEGAVEQSTTNFLSAVAENEFQDQSPDVSNEVIAPVVEVDNQVAIVEQDDAADELSRQVDAEQAAAEELGAQILESEDPAVQETDVAEEQRAREKTEALKQPAKFSAELDTSAYCSPDGPQTPSDTGIHPITVRYCDVVMPLFKSRAQPDGLLKDDNLASVSLGDLLDSCRTRLAVKVGEDVSADQELVLSFENMGLQVIEHSPHAFETSLDDVLQVYLKLHHNDATHPVPALALSLSLQLKFTSSFSVLKAAAQQGEGMSKFSFMHSGADEVDEYGDEDEEEHEVYKYEDDEYEGNDGDVANGESPYLEGQEYEESQHQDDQDIVQSEGRQDETNYEEQQHTDQRDESEHHDTNDGTAVEGGGGAQDHTETYLIEAAAEYDDGRSVEDAAQELEEPLQTESTASSTTVRGDLVDDTTEPNADDEADDLSARVDEFAADDADAAAAESNEDRVAEAAKATNEAFAFDFLTGDHLDQQPAERLGDEEADDTTAPTEARREIGNDLGQHGQDEDPHAHDLNSNEADLPCEGDEHANAGFHLLEDHDFESGAESGGQKLEPNQAADDFGYDDDDDIGFNDDVEEAILASNSPLGKRSFDEHVGNDQVADEQDLKKPRSG